MLNSQASIKGKGTIIFASVIGNIVETFDFTLYAILLPSIAIKFFPLNSNFSSFLMSFAVFAVGFCARPFGSVIFGYVGDRFGRRVALIYSLSLMGFATFFIGLLPTYESIGIAAPIILILCRSLQGLSMGGEFASSSIFLIEYFSKKEGLAGGIIISSIVFGAFLATSLGYLVVHEDILDYAWRFPFLVGGILAGIGMCFRMVLEETPQYKILMINNKTSKFPLFEIFKSYPYELFLVIGICAYAGAISYTLLAYNVFHLIYIKGLNLNHAMYFNNYGLCVFSLSSIFFGYLADRIGSGLLLLYSSLAGILLSIPIYYYMEYDNNFYMITAEILTGLLAGSYCSAQLAFVSNFFPTRIRCSAVCLGHSIGIAALGGTFPVIVLYLIDKFDNSLMAGVYLTFCSLIGFAFVTLGIKIHKKSPMQKDITTRTLIESKLMS
jgi:MHS family proline/betaine transporter-like MFS transporter